MIHILSLFHYPELDSPAILDLVLKVFDPGAYCEGFEVFVLCQVVAYRICSQRRKREQRRFERFDDGKKFEMTCLTLHVWRSIHLATKKNEPKQISIRKKFVKLITVLKKISIVQYHSISRYVNMRRILKLEEYQYP